MNKKSQSLGLAIITMIVFLIVGFVFLNFLKPEINRARNSDNLDCANTLQFPDGPSSGGKMLCLITGTIIPYFVIIVLSISAGIVTNLFIGGGR